jgi:NAD(P)-dependent dehydrogenase (short-subunit alcohol dehydrogenase family)
MTIDLAGKRVLVTGASIGIGREIALQFAAAGSRLALTYLEHRAEAEDVAKRCLGLGATDVLVTPFWADDDESIEALREAVVERFAGLDLLVNNAGIVIWRRFLEQSFAEIEAQVSINLLAVMKLTWVLLPVVDDAVITVGSTASLHGTATAAPYCASKWGLRGFVKALALEHPEMRIVSVHPPRTATRMNDFVGASPLRVAEVVLKVARGEIEMELGGDVDVRDHLGR